MSFDQDKDSQPLNGYTLHNHHALQQLYNNPPGMHSPISGVMSSPGHRLASSYPLYSNSTSSTSTPTSTNANPNYLRYPYMTFQQQQQQQQQQQKLALNGQGYASSPDMLPSLNGTPGNTTPSTNTAASTPSASASHMAKQLSYAQLSRQCSSPHHHARAAAQVARSAPTSTSVTITDPNNPAKSFAKANDHRSSPAQRYQGVPDAPGNMWSILDMGGMGLKNISVTVCSYDFLTTLYVNHNSLTFLPPSLSHLSKLRTLDASGNKLSSIPPEIGLMINLKELLLFDNNLVTVPPELGTLYQLETLGLEGNPLQPDLSNLLMKEGTQAVIVSLREHAPVGLPPPSRHWITVENDTSDNDKDKLSVLCYNTLCQKYATPQAYGYTPSWALAWDYRKELIVSEILNWNADVVCLQEVEMSQYDGFIGDTLKQQGNYEGVFFPKSRAKTMNEKERQVVDGCATFYKADKFHLVEYHLLEYNQTALKRDDFKRSEDVYNRVMTKDNIAVMTILENKETLQRVLVTNSHIHWDPAFADVKLVQVGMLMEDMEQFASKHLKPPTNTCNEDTNRKPPTYASVADLPTVICGDFNSTHESGVVEFLSSGNIQQDHHDFGNHVYGTYTTEGLSHPLSLKSAYASGDIQYTNYTPTFKGVLDYIWYTSNTIESLSLLGPIENPYFKKVVGFPNAHFPSDHIPIAAEFKFRAPRPEKLEKPNFGLTSRR